MSFLRHGEIYPFDKGAITQDRAPAHRKDESPAGYSLAGCTPAEPASASPADAHLAGKRLRCTMHFQRTARCVLAIRLNPGDNPRLAFAPYQRDALRGLQRGGVEHASSLAPLTDGRLLKRQYMCHQCPN
jgi:hypothetical protein